MKTSIHPFTNQRLLFLTLTIALTAAPTFAQTGAIPALPISSPAGEPAATTPAAPTTVATPPAGVIDPQAKALLEKVVARYSNLKSLSLDIERSGRHQLLEFRAPQSVKVTSTDATGAIRTQQLYSATDLTSLQKINDVYEWKSSPLRPAPAGQEGRASVANTGAGGLFLSSLLAGVNPFQSPRYASSSITLAAPGTVDGVAVNSIVVTQPKSERQPYQTTLTFLIGQQDSLVHEIHTDTKLPDGTTASSVEKYTQIQPDALFTDATFTFTPPTGANKVENFSQPQVKATVGQAPLAINGKDILGKDISLSQYKGKVVLVDFWATWCGPCVGELPNVKANYEKYHDQGFDVLGISLDRSTDPLNKFIQEKAIPWRQVFDGYWEGPIATAFNVRAIPSTLLIGRDGRVAAIGARGEALEPAIKAALAAN